jgi:hypothetical protein
MSEYNYDPDYIKKYIRGGFDGLEDLYENYFIEFERANYQYNKTPFKDFLSGDVIKVQYREEEPKEYKIETFFEDHFNYKLHQSGGFIFTFANHMISQIDDIATDAKLSENNRTSKLITLVKYIEFEIINSDKCHESDNPLLYPKLQKFKLNFIHIYNEIFDLYSQYFPNYKKNDFNPSQISNKPKSYGSDSVKDISCFIYNVTDKVAFLNELKSICTEERGKRIKAIITILEDEKIVVIPDGKFKNFTELLEEYFERNIGKYQGINDPKDLTVNYLKPFKTKLKTLITRYKLN